ncbi:hypothetical protein N8987_03390 [Crocinitomix sp.]|nr:hypothetical protein [Crocinitomix sp.]
MNRIIYICLFGCLIFAGNLFAQSTKDSSLFKPDASGLYPKILKKSLSTISISGYYRTTGNYSVMKEQYAEFEGVNNRLFIGDDSNLPQLSLNISGRPTKNTSFSTDLYLWTPLTGSETDYVQGLLLGVNMTGAHSTRYGTFTVKTGGIHWYSLSPFTFQANTGYNRFSLFERNPWDPITRTPLQRYEDFYVNGALSQDVRWGNQAFQGIIIDGMRLPKEFSFAFMHGKSQFNGGALPTPNTMTAGRIKKDFDQSFVSINGIRSKTFTDSLAAFAVGFNLISSEFKLKFDNFTLAGEVGAGNYFSPTATNDWGEAIDIRLQLSEDLTHFPIEIRYFQISPNVINNNGVFWNSSIEEYNDNLSTNQVEGGQTVLNPFASSLVNIGQLTNNRRGLILNTDLKFGKHKLTLGYSAASEILALSNRITYGHPANNLALSRFWRWAFPANVGPYGNINKIYRGVYETLNITDSVAAKGFNSVEVSYKYETKIAGRKFLVFYLGGFHSVQESFSALPKYSDKAYLQSYNNQLEFYFALTPKLVLSNYFGYDRNFANEQTELDVVSLKPKNQEGMSYGIGLDIQLAKNTGLYLRQRWMKYQDFNFSLDRYLGMESTVELKIFF